MRTLKKALSLVLVLAMVFALAVPGFAAVSKGTELTDYSKIQNKEAVDVLVALSVISGRDDKSFDPTGNFTRAEAATMISYLTLGKSLADALTTGATQFNDVPATHWAAKYIQYCAKEGIINGYGDGKFGPDDKLTNAQWALMLLGALGYSTKNENIGGAGWEIAATRLAVQSGIASSDDMAQDFNRDVAAKMALNTLKADLVEYNSNGVVVSGSDMTVTVGASKATEVANKSENETIDDDKIMQFAEEHFPKLEIGSATADDFGRPGIQWKLSGKEIGTYADTSDLIVSYTAKTKESTVAADLKGWTLALTKAANFKDGVAEADSADDSATITAISDISALTKNGVVVEVYGEDSKIDRVVVIEPVLAKVSNVNTKTEKVTYTAVGDGSAWASTEIGYGRVSKDDYVMVSLSNNAVAAVDSTTVVTGKATAYVTGQNITVDGSKYTVGNGWNANPRLNVEQNVYLDTYGYAVHADDVSSTGNYLVVTKNIWATQDELGNNVYKAQVVFADGSVEVVTVTNTSGDKGFYSYTTSNGKYTLEEIEAGDDASTAAYAHASSETSIAKGANKLGNHYFASDVNFVVISNPGQSNIKVNSYTGKQIINSATGLYYVTTKEVTAGTTGTISTVFVLSGSVATSNTDLIFTTATGNNGKTWIGNKEVETMSVYVNGEKQDIPVNGAVSDLAGTSADGAFFTYTVDEDGIYTLSSTDNNVYTNKGITVYNNFVSFAGEDGDYTADDDVQVIDVRTDGSIESLDGIQNATNDEGTKLNVSGSAVVNENDKTVSIIYVTGATT